MSTKTLAALAAIVAMNCATPVMAGQGEATGPVVRTSLGQVRGVEADGIRTFMGIPYAQPPVGELRWAPPRPATPWSGVRQAKTPPSACAQTVTPGLANPNSHFAEDCLYLNVTVPKSTNGKPVPVMVWIHGGGFSNGEGRDYDPRRLVADGKMMVVTFNYRLGVFGFGAIKGVDGSGVFGLQDQQLALRWVAKNAAAFGGDPGNITLFGESAGAMSTCAQLVSPSAKGLFHKAILQSGSCIQRWPASMVYPGLGPLDQFASLAEVEELTAESAKEVGCAADDIACLRRVPAEALLKTWVLSRPAYGTSVLPTEPAKALRAGEFHRVPLIWGSTRDEWRPSAGAYLLKAPFTQEAYAGFLKDAFGDRAGEVQSLYPAAAAGSPAYAWGAVSTDVAWSCPTLLSARLASRRMPVFMYEFADRDAPNPAFNVAPDFDIGAAHATDLAYLFDLAGSRADLEPAQEQLAETMRRYWTNFAHTGNPAGAGLPAWPAFDSDADANVLSFAPGAVSLVDFSARHHCDFWSSMEQGG